MPRKTEVTAEDLERHMPDPLERAKHAHDRERFHAGKAAGFGAVRRRAIAEMVEGGRSMAEVAKELDISKAMVQKVVQRHREITITSTLTMTDSIEVTLTRGEPKNAG